jgi:hypothetical protein
MKDRPKRSRGKRGKDGTLSRKNSRMVKTNLNHMPSIGTLEHSKRSGDQDTLRIPLRDAAQLNADDSDPNI